MTSDRELGNRLARVVDRISRREFKLTQFDAALEGGDIIIVMRLKRTDISAAKDRAAEAKRKKPTVIDLIFED